MVPLGPAAPAPPANSGEGKGVTTGITCTCPMGMCLPFLPGTHLFSFHLGSYHGPIRADDDTRLPLLPLQEKRRWERTWRGQAPSCDRAGVTWWPGRTGTRNVTTPWNAGGLEQLPSTLGHPGDQLTPGLLSVPRDPAGRTQPTSFPTHQRQSPNSPSITTTLQQSTAGLATTAVTRATPWSPDVSLTHREASVAWSALQREAEMLLRANPLFPKTGCPPGTAEG